MLVFRSSNQIVGANLLKQSVRHATSKRTPPRADKKISVQLLKDFANVGVRGEIVKVLPSVMRNYLHMNNGATYLTKDKGPRIPVVDRSVYIAQQEKIKQKETEALALQKKAEAEKKAQEARESNEASALSLDELSNLFQNVKRRPTKSSKAVPVAETAAESEESFEAVAEILYTSLDITQAIPQVYNVQLGPHVILPITKDNLVEQFYNTAGLELPSSALTLLAKESREAVDEVIAPGSYIISIEVPNERDPVERQLVVQ